MLRTGVIPIPPARNTVGLVTSLCDVNDPVGGLTLSLVPTAAAFRAVLKPVPRIRIAIMIGSLSRGELASEKVRHRVPGNSLPIRKCLYQQIISTQTIDCVPFDARFPVLF